MNCFKSVIVCLKLLIKLLKLVALRVPSLFAVGSSCLMCACCCLINLLLYSLTRGVKSGMGNYVTRNVT